MPRVPRSIDRLERLLIGMNGARRRKSLRNLTKLGCDKLRGRIFKIKSMISLENRETRGEAK